MEALRRGALLSAQAAFEALWRVLDVSVEVMAAAASVFARMLRSPLLPHRVVVIGGGFAGIHAARDLRRHFDAVTLVSPQSYFEYTPGVLRLFVDPGHFGRLAAPLPGDVGELVLGSATGVEGREVVVAGPSGGASRIPFDYLVLCSGSSYSRPIKPSPAEPGLGLRRATWLRAAAALRGARSVIIVGGGPVGVELAAEILDSGLSARVTIVSRAPTLCRGFPPRSRAYAERWLRSRGASLLLGAAVARVDPGGVVLQDGTAMSADIVYDCTACSPNGRGLARRGAVDGSGAVAVDRHLRVAGSPAGGRVFACGDVMRHPSGPRRLAHVAECSARVVAGNVVADATEGTAAPFPEAAAAGAKQVPLVYIISLGRFDATMGLRGLVLSGSLAAFAKWVLEFTKVDSMRGGRLANAFWDAADWAAVRVARLLPDAVG